MINDFLLSLTAATADELYVGFGCLQYPAYIGMITFYSFQYPTTKKEKVLLCIIFAISLYWGNTFCSILSRISNGIVPGINMGVAFLFFLLIVTSGSYMLHIPVFLSLDALVPVFILGRGLAIIGCIFTGCCYGFPCAWGIYSPRTELTVFPTVIIDAFFSYAIVAFLVILAQRSRYSGDGRVCAIGLMLFGLLRVVIDILRDNWKLVSVFTVEGLFGMLYILVGMYILWSIYRRSKQAPSAIDRS